MRSLVGVEIGDTPRVLAKSGSAVLAAALWLGTLDFLLTRFVRGAVVPAAGLGGLLRGHVLVLLALGLAVVVLGRLGELAWKRWGRGGKRLRAAWFGGFFALAGLWPVAALGRQLAGGDWISQQWFAGLVRYGVSVTLFLGVAFIAAHVVWTESKRVWPGVWLVLTVAAAYVNGKILVGLYPAFHVALYVFAAVMSLLAAEGLLRRLEGKAPWARSWFVAAPVALGVLVAAYSGFAMQPKSRGLALRSSPQLAQVLTLFVPRADKDVLRQTIDFEEFRERERPARVKLGRKPKNVILIVIDAFRADALPPVRSEKTFYQRPGDTPFFDEWLTSAYRFSNAYSQASRTNRSVPATLYSRETYEDVVQVGVPLALRARQVGLKPLAVVPDWYMLPNSKDAAKLLEGFERVETYRRDHTQNRFRGLVKNALVAAGKQPFFLWLHYYGMHDPYYIGAKKKHPQGATFGEKYRAALRYMDREFSRIHGELGKRKLLEDTLIVLMADHGEFLGERGLERHGLGIYEEEMHVPLAVWVPGAKSGDVQALVGNIDVVPTIFDLLQDPNEGVTKGRSLVPEMSSLAKESDRALYVVSSSGTRMGLITQEHKLQFDLETGSFGAFLRSDAAQAEDILGYDPLLDRSLVLEFVSRNPGLFREELKKPETRDALRARLEGRTQDMSLPRLGFLLELAALSEDAQILETARKTYDASPALERKLLVLSRLYATDRKHWSGRAQELLEKYRGRPEEASLVADLARQNVRGLDSAFVAARLAEVAEDCGSPLAAAWLSLLDELDRAHAYGPPLAQFLECAEAKDPKGESLLPRVLGSVESLEVSYNADLEKRILPFLRHKNDWVAVTAVRALGAVGGQEAVDALTGMLDGREGAPRGSDRMVESAILALARLRGAELTPSLVEWGKERTRVFAVVRALEQVGDERAVPYLEGKSTTKDLWMGRTVRAALKVVRERVAKR